MKDRQHSIPTSLALASLLLTSTLVLGAQSGPVLDQGVMQVR